jgi:hypothetical protein
VCVCVCVCVCACVCVCVCVCERFWEFARRERVLEFARRAFLAQAHVPSWCSVLVLVGTRRGWFPHTRAVLRVEEVRLSTHPARQRPGLPDRSQVQFQEVDRHLAEFARVVWLDRRTCVSVGHPIVGVLPEEGSWNLVCPAIQGGARVSRVEVEARTNRAHPGTAGAKGLCLLWELLLQSFNPGAIGVRKDKFTKLEASDHDNSAVLSPGGSTLGTSATATVATATATAAAAATAATAATASIDGGWWEGRGLGAK